MDLNECVQDMINYIEDNLDKEITLDNVANHVYYSPFYCSRAFSSRAGVRLKDYLRLRRISEAANALKGSDNRVIDIAMRFGYGSQEAFSRAFLDVFNLTPAMYRKNPIPLPLYLRFSLNHQHKRQGDVTMKEKY